jgi:hypothetical protein
MFRTFLGISSHNSNMPKSQFDMGNAGQRGGQVSYLFRACGGVNGVPLPSSAQYRLWILPKSRPLVEPQAVLKRD